MTPGTPGRRLRRRLHPVAWFGPVAASLVAMMAWIGVGHSSGSGWVQAVGAVLAAVLITGLVAPSVPARRASVVCTDNPTDSHADRPVVVSLVANGPIRLRPRQPMGPTTSALGRLRGPRPVELELTPAHRGVVEKIAVELASSAPFGLLWWAREVEVELSRPLHVAPRPAQAGPMGLVTHDSSGDAPQRIPAGVGEPRGVRPYRSGDARRAVHWPATAHAGSLMVREQERQQDEPIIIDALLPPDPIQAEAEAERVMATVADCLARGQPVVLGTDERDGRVVRPVRDRIDLGRRLARAVPRPRAVAEPSPPPPWWRRTS